MYVPDDSPMALRPRDAARALGISPRLLWQLTKEGRIPHIVLGDGKRRTVRYPVPVIQAWLASQAASNAAEGL